MIGSKPGNADLAETVFAAKLYGIDVNIDMKKMNVKTTSEQVDEILKKVKELGVKKKGLVNDDEFKRILKEILEK